MKKIGFLALALAALIPVEAECAQGKTATSSIISVTSDKITVRTGANAGYKIVNIDNNGLKTTQRAANIETFTLKPWSTITLNGLPAKLADLKPGMKVLIAIGTDRTVASSISATVVPPAQKADATDKTPPAKGKGPRKIGQGIDSYKVTALGSDVITVAQSGGKKSISYKIRQFTEISVNGKRSQLNAVKVGMEVLVVAGADPTIASSIKAEDAD
jgi:hypothetical protein